MNYLLYILPIVCFIIVAVSMYTVSADEEKSNFSVIFTRNILPALVISALVFVIIKFKDSGAFVDEPMKTGNYF
jgi:hypothetical protein